MVYTRNGESITADGVTFAVGDRIIATDSDYAGLKGYITEIRTGADKKTICLHNFGYEVYPSIRVLCNTYLCGNCSNGPIRTI